MQVWEILYGILHHGMKFLKECLTSDDIYSDFLAEILGRGCLKYLTRPLEASRKPDRETSRAARVSRNRRASNMVSTPVQISIPTESLADKEQPGERRRTIVELRHEDAMEMAYSYLIESLVNPRRRRAVLRRAERRVAKNEVAYAEKCRVTQIARQPCRLGELEDVIRAGFCAAGTALKENEMRAIKKEAQTAAVKSLWRVLSELDWDMSMIEDALAEALNAGMYTVRDDNQDKGLETRGAVQASLEDFLNRIETSLRKSVLPLKEVRQLRTLAEGDPEADGESTSTVDLVTGAFLKGAEFAARQRGYPIDGPMWKVVLGRLTHFSERLEKSLVDPKRVGTKALDFLRSEIATVKKKAWQRALPVPIKGEEERIARQVRIHLGDLEKKGHVVSRRKKGVRGDFWGLSGWGKDKSRWDRTSTEVDTAELAEQLPVYGGEPKTTGSIDYGRLDTFLPLILRHHDRWLLVKHLSKVIFSITRSPVFRAGDDTEDDEMNWRDPIENLEDPSAHRFVRDLEILDVIEKEKMSGDLQEYFGAVRRHRGNYQHCLEELEGKGWQDWRIKKAKSELLSVLHKVKLDKELGLKERKNSREAKGVKK